VAALAQVSEPGNDGTLQVAAGAGFTVTVPVWVMGPQPHPDAVQEMEIVPPEQALKEEEVMVPFADPLIRQLPD